MRVATWNLQRCSPRSYARGPRIRELMCGINADVWVLTETHRDFSPGPNYSLIAHSADAHGRDAAHGECWVAIWSRLPAQEVPLTADVQRVAAARVGDTTVVGIVLPWLTDNRDGRPGHETFRSRLAQQVVDWKRLRTESLGLCVAGDFNQDLLAVGHYYGSADGREALRAALDEAYLECLTEGDDDPLAKYGLACIDHICVGGLETRESPRSSVWPTPGQLTSLVSDHYGFYADVSYLAGGS